MIRYMPAATLLMLAACSGGGEGNNSAEAESGLVEEKTDANLEDDPQNTAVPLTTPTTAPTASPSPIAALPPAFQGRWGMVDNDCVPGRADAKGLMIVSADGLGFYESRGKVEQATASGPGTLTLDLAFTGEGQEWNRTETLTLMDGGKTLVREEQKPAGSFRYTKCPSGKANPTPRENGA